MNSAESVVSVYKVSIAYQRGLHDLVIIDGEDYATLTTWDCGWAYEQKVLVDVVEAYFASGEWEIVNG